MKQFVVDHEEIKVRISEWGNKDNPTVICIHGLGNTSLSFLELGELLGNEYHIFSIDLPGHGKTPPFEKDIVKRIEASHFLHWDNPFIVAEEAICWMK